MGAVGWWAGERAGAAEIAGTGSCCRGLDRLDRGTGSLTLGSRCLSGWPALGRAGALGGGRTQGGQRGCRGACGGRAVIGEGHGEPSEVVVGHLGGLGAHG